MIVSILETINEFEPFGRRVMPLHPKQSGLMPLKNASFWTSAETDASRDLFRSLRAVAVRDNTQRENWRLRDCTEGEEELYFNDKVVVWSKSDGNQLSHLIKTFTMENRICDAIWCHFTDELSQTTVKTISILDNSSLEIFTNNGDHFPIALQFQVNAIFATKYGLLLERQYLNSELKDNPLPLVFGLTHPLKEISPVIISRPANAFRAPQIGYLNIEDKLELVAVIQDWSLLVFFHKTNGNHIVYSLREATEEEIKHVTAICGSSTIDYVSDSSLIDSSPFVSSYQNNAFNTNSCSSPFRNRSHSSSKQGMSSAFGMSSTPSTINPSTQSITRSLTTSTSPSLLSPLRSSRLGASPCYSPSYRVFGATPANSSVLNDPQINRLKDPYTPFLSPLIASPRNNRSIDFLNDDISEPIIPELFLQHIWSEGQSLITEKASKVFISSDLMGQSYVCMLLSGCQSLKMTRLDYSNDRLKLIFGSTNVISAKDAEPVPSLNMIVTVDPNNNLILYCGLSKTCIIHLPTTLCTAFTNSLLLSPSSTFSSKSLSYQSPSYKRSSLISSSRPSSSTGNVNPSFHFESKILSPVIPESDTETSSFVSSLQYPTIGKIISVRDAVRDRITVQSVDSTLYRFSLPPISTSSIVSRCLSVLKNVLPRDMSLHLLTKWYSVRNAPNSEELNTSSEMNLFKSCLLSLIGYDSEGLNAPYSPNQSPEVIKKMKFNSEEGSDDDWNWLISGEDVSHCVDVNRVVPISPSTLFPYLPSILYSLHLLYEELKLIEIDWNLCPLLVDMLFMFAVDLKLIPYQIHYIKDYPNKCSSISLESRIPDEDMKNISIPSYFRSDCPSVFSTITQLLGSNANKQLDNLFPYITNSTKNIYKFILLFANLRTNELIDSSKVLLPINANKCDNENGFDHLKYNNIYEKTVLLMDHLGITQDNLKLFPSGLSIPLWDAIFFCRNNPSNGWHKSAFQLIGRPDLSALLPPYKKPVKHQTDVKLSADLSEAEEDGISHLDYDLLKLLFPEDQRILEAYNMLMSSKPVKIAIQQRNGVSDHDFIEEQERHLYTICIRTMALPLGRGMLTLRSYTPVVAETFPIPKLNLVGRVPPRNNTIDLSHIEVPQNMNTWPLFHNGVAAGLRISAHASGIIDSSWIVYNRPKSSSPLSSTTLSSDSQNEHAGFLLALGLNGHLACLSTMSIHDYLCKGNELTRVAVLLGLAAAKRGTMDVSAIKVLSIHVEALLPPTSTELDVPPIVQVAAVLGIGLLYQGSGQHHIAEVMLGEIGRPPGPEMEHYIDRESYALSAGLAFGLVTLGKGNDMIGLVSTAEGMSMADQLCHFMLGGHKRPLTSLQREKYKTPSYQIREGDCINADVTSPGATLALGMMFFNTNNTAVAQWFTVPDTQHLLEMVRPDFILLRTLCKGLIMWADVEPTKTWVESHMPRIVSDNAFQRNPNESNDRLDYETMSQAYCNIVAGACFALSLKYAGSANHMAFKTVMNYTQRFITLSSKTHLAEQAGRSTIEACLNVLVVSLAIIMSGTGNIEVLRICRYLRSRLNQAYVLYGSHMAIHMAMGLLFLAGCRSTLCSTPEAVATLIIAFFPKYPIHSNDNRYHLQAFRHLYVLATEPRLVIPRDIDTGKAVYVNLHCVVADKSQSCEIIKLKAPCFLSELHRLDNVVVDDERYWRISFEKDKNWKSLERFLKRDGILYVKQKTGCLPYSEDPKGFKSLYAQSVMKDAVKGWAHKVNTTTEFSNDRIVLTFSKYLLTNASEIEAESEIKHKMCSLLFDCASNERLEFLSPLINLMKQSQQTNSHSLWQIKVADRCAHYCQSLRSDFIDSIRSVTEKRIKNSIDKNKLCQYLRGTLPLKEVDTPLIEALVFYDMPAYGSFSALSAKLSLVELILELQPKYGTSVPTISLIHRLFFS